MSESECVFLSPTEAEAMLPEGEMIHTFRQAGDALIGTDWERSEIIKAFQTRRPELSGENATAMKHGIVFFDDYGAVFVETAANSVEHPDKSSSANRENRYEVGSMPPSGYIAWDEWASAQTEGGLKQSQCAGCRLWLFPQEMKSHNCRTAK